MKKTLILVAVIVFASSVSLAQANGKGKSKGKGKVAEKVKGPTNKDKEDKQKHENAIWDGTKDNDGGGPKPSKNQPAKVRSAFQRDYPNAMNVSWSKYRGDWTATFKHGLYWSTAVYHANGDRRDTRTLIPKEQAPVKIIDIFKKKPTEKIGEVIKIEEPKTGKLLYRVKVWLEGKSKYQNLDAEGNEVQYNY